MDPSKLMKTARTSCEKSAFSSAPMCVLPLLKQVPNLHWSGSYECGRPATFQRPLLQHGAVKNAGCYDLPRFWPAATIGNVKFRKPMHVKDGDHCFWQVGLGLICVNETIEFCCPSEAKDACSCTSIAN